MKIIILTDLHLVAPQQLTDQGYDVNAQFHKIIAHLNTIDFDRIIILGDICYREGEYEIYDWFFDEIEKLNKPYDLIAGNHDNPEMIIKILEQETADTYDKKIFYAKELAGKPCLFLDTSDYTVSDKQVEWLKNKLLENHNDLLIFMHHPPCSAGVPYMDTKYFLQNRRDIKLLLKNQDYTIDVFCGHYHVDKDLVFENVNIHICPSPFFFIDQSTLEFNIEKQVACFKLLEIDNEDIRLQSIYL